MDTKIVVTSSSHLPRFCAGKSFIGATAFPLGTFDAEQLLAITSDRMLTVVVGRVLTHADVPEFAKAIAHLPPAPAEIDAVGAQLGAVDGLSIYPAGAQAAVVDGKGDAVVDPAHAVAIGPETHSISHPATTHATTHKGKAAK